MNIIQRIANKLASPQKNALGDSMGLAQDFFRFGPRRRVIADWSMLNMDERDKYTGYMYGAITRRVNKVSWLAQYNLMTRANDETDKKAREDKKPLRHPYIDIIDESSTFANDEFWRTIQTFLDLKGHFFLMAVRGATAGGKVGTINYFKLINPYDVTVVYDSTNIDVIGYTEVRGGMIREIPPHMIITIRNLNPFSHTEPYSIADAAKDSQFTLKEISEQMRTTSRRNRKYPGVVLMGNGEVVLDPEQVENFKSRMQGKGGEDEPVFASGSASTLSWNDMQVDMRKSAVDVVNEAELNALIAVTGTSKTKLGIEQSGVTRDTAAIQDDLFVSDQAMPALQLIIDALNQDYKNNYPEDYKKYGYQLYIESPLKEDKLAEQTDVTNRTDKFALYQLLINKGYDAETAAQYASGDKSLLDIGLPTNPLKEAAPSTPPATDVSQESKASPIDNKRHVHSDNVVAPAIYNELDLTSQTFMEQSQAALKNAVINVEHQLVTAALNKVTKNDALSDNDIIDFSDRTESTGHLRTALQAFYDTVIPIAAVSAMKQRTKEFNMLGTFKADTAVNDYIHLTATRAADSHVETVLGDILNTVRDTEERLVQGELKKIETKPGQTPEEKLRLARSLALEGPGREKLAAAIRQEYSDTISKVRATTIARTENVRAFNRAQFEADRQFLNQNDLMHRAYKKWVTRSDNPCPYCTAKAAEPPIPFMDAFARVGDVLSAPFELADGTQAVRQMKVGFEDCMAAEIHPNGQCKYQLIIQ